MVLLLFFCPDFNRYFNNFCRWCEHYITKAFNFVYMYNYLSFANCERDLLNLPHAFLQVLETSSFLKYSCVLETGNELFWMSLDVCEAR